ncbi:MAG: hypothetical protein V3R14_06245, partial [Nitrospinaceae bacterium]
MTSPKPSFPRRFRLQGTDGIRREVCLSTDPSLKGLSPLQAFLDKGAMTDEFMERYVYAHAISLIRAKQLLKRGDSCVVGWDPRDTQGRYTRPVVRGIRKAGINALVLGVVPTPLIPMVML